MCIYIYTHILFIYIYMYIHTHIHIYIYIHRHTHIYIIYRQNKKTMKKKLVLYSKVKQNQPDRCRFFKADMEKYVASIV